MKFTEYTRCTKCNALRKIVVTLKKRPDYVAPVGVKPAKWQPVPFYKCQDCNQAGGLQKSWKELGPHGLSKDDDPHIRANHLEAMSQHVLLKFFKSQNFTLLSRKGQFHQFTLCPMDDQILDEPGFYGKNFLGKGRKEYQKAPYQSSFPDFCVGFKNYKIAYEVKTPRPYYKFGSIVQNDLTYELFKTYGDEIANELHQRRLALPDDYFSIVLVDLSAANQTVYDGMLDVKRALGEHAKLKDICMKHIHGFQFFLNDRKTTFKRKEIWFDTEEEKVYHQEVGMSDLFTTDELLNKF